jgi:predicted outer membrane repeat protein
LAGFTLIAEKLLIDQVTVPIKLDIIQYLESKYYSTFRTELNLMNLKKSLLIALPTILSFYLSLSSQAGIIGNGTAASCTQSAIQTEITKGGLITFNCGGWAEIKLDAPLIIGSGKVSLDGGASKISLNGQNKTRIIYTGNSVDLTVKNIDFTNGNATGTTKDDGSGGAIHSGYQSKLTAIGCGFTNNKASANSQEGGGGAIFSKSLGFITLDQCSFIGNTSDNFAGALHLLLSSLKATNTTFSMNKASVLGGAIYIDGAINKQGTIDISNCNFSGNTSGDQAGGIYTCMYTRDIMTVKNSTFDKNTATKDHGGGIAAFCDGTLNIDGSSITNNAAGSHGGGIYTEQITNITNSTITGNKTTKGGGMGGGISNLTGGRRLEIKKCTIEKNSAEYGGGIGVSNNKNVYLGETHIGNNISTNPYKVYLQCIGSPFNDLGTNSNWQNPIENNPGDPSKPHQNCTEPIKPYGASSPTPPSATTAPAPAITITKPKPIAIPCNCPALTNINCQAGSTLTKENYLHWREY